MYTRAMAKHLIDIDETALAAARAALGTRSIKDTVNAALTRIGAPRRSRVTRALDGLAKMPPFDREEAWR